MGGIEEKREGMGGGDRRKERGKGRGGIEETREGMGGG